MKEDNTWYSDTGTVRRGTRCDHKMLLEKLQLIVTEIVIVLVVILVLSSGTDHSVRVNELDKTWIVLMLESEQQLLLYHLPHHPESSRRCSQ